jgi:hypothetical protein
MDKSTAVDFFCSGVLTDSTDRSESLMNDSFLDYYRCPERFIRFQRKGPLSSTSGFFRFGDDATCYGSYFGIVPTEVLTDRLHDAKADVALDNGTIYLPFDPSEVAHNLRYEIYAADWRGKFPLSALSKLYYFVRPMLPVRVRKHLQKFHLITRGNRPFPRWPVDFSVDNLLGQLMLLVLKSNRIDRLPFIWFWPDRAPSAAIMTHDVETEQGRGFCSALMDINSSFDIRSSFQLIPEQRYVVTQEFLNSIRQRGFEVAVHDLNHDGHLYKNRRQFLERVPKINSYGKQYNANGFRAGVLYRRQIWYDALDFSYDMSVPNVANFDPQHGGCCTVIPYFLGRVLELPVTTTQDYTLFHLLNDYSIDLWKQQIELIMNKHGLVSVIVHPDYIMQSREQDIYKALLGHLIQLRKEKSLWITTPGEINHWWRQRAEMKLVEDGNTWKIEGPGNERASVAFASERDGKLVFTF